MSSLSPKCSKVESKCLNHLIKHLLLQSILAPKAILTIRDSTITYMVVSIFLNEHYVLIVFYLTFFSPYLKGKETERDSNTHWDLALASSLYSQMITESMGEPGAKHSVQFCNAGDGAQEPAASQWPFAGRWNQSRVWTWPQSPKQYHTHLHCCTSHPFL